MLRKIQTEQSKCNKLDLRANTQNAPITGGGHPYRYSLLDEGESTRCQNHERRSSAAQRPERVPYSPGESLVVFTDQSIEVNHITRPTSKQVQQESHMRSKHKAHNPRRRSHDPCPLLSSMCPSDPLSSKKQNNKLSGSLRLSREIAWDVDRNTGQSTRPVA